MIKDKITKREALAAICEKLRSKGKTIGFTSGAFDLLHAGHVDYLEKARQMCDVLIVGINSDSSVSQYKGDNRPIINEKHRVRVVAALEAVDYVFVFKERRNKKNIEVIRPHYYIKAGDYTPDQLTSKKIVESYGGEVKIIPVEEELSTTHIMEKIRSLSVREAEEWIDKENTAHKKIRPIKKSPAVFLDRDGTINEDVGYLHDPKKLVILAHALEGIKMFHDMGYKIIIITNQPGIGIGYFPEEDFYRVNRAMLSKFSKAGIKVDKILFCPHSKSENCDCRKPNQALVERAINDLNIDIRRSYFIGDKTTDTETGRRAGMKTIIVDTGNKGTDDEFPGEPDIKASDILDAAQKVLKMERR